MKTFFATCWTENLKVRRSKMSWIVILISLIMPMFMGLLMFVAKNPELAHEFGMIGTKAAILNIEADWPTYLEFLHIIIVMIGFVGFGFVTAWVFGREHSDRTVKDLLALPTPRSFIVLAKFIVVVMWYVLFALIFIVVGFAIGGMIGLAGYSSEMILHGVYTLAVAALLTLLLCTPVAFVTCIGRGYLLPLAFIIIVMGATQFIGIFGLAPYFPWAIPVLYTVVAGVVSGPESAQLGIISYTILFLTSIFGLIGTVAWWRFADQF